MVWYETLEPRAPLRSQTISPELVRRLMQQRHNKGFRAEGIAFATTKRAEQAGLVLPPRLTLHKREGASHVRDFYFVPIGDGVDGFVSYRDGPQVNYFKPSWEAINETYLPLEGEALEAAEGYVKELCQLLGVPLEAGDSGPLEQKLRALPAADPNIDSLIGLCEALGVDCGLPSIVDLIEAARDPRGFVLARELIESMTVQDCRDFSWRARFVPALQAIGALQVLDWKSGREEVLAAVAALDPEAPFEYSSPPADGDGLFEHLETAGDELARREKVLIMLGDAGDAIAFTLIGPEQANSVLALATTLGLEPFDARPGVAR